MTTQVVNEEVDVTALYFRKSKNGLKTFPKRIHYAGNDLNFFESGLQVMVNKGQELVELFTMTDGANDYRLRHDVKNRQWQLLSITQNA
jgi:hypothetical protein